VRPFPWHAGVLSGVARQCGSAAAPGNEHAKSQANLIE
jgi:hypothetical protein